MVVRPSRLVEELGFGMQEVVVMVSEPRRNNHAEFVMSPPSNNHNRKRNFAQSEYRLKLGAAYESHDLVFASEIGGPIHYRNLTQRYYEKILKEAGLENEGFVLYSLRHSCATLLLIAETNPKVVAERLGHTSVKMTLDTYSHVLPSMQRDATDRLESLLYATTLNS